MKKKLFLSLTAAVGLLCASSVFAANEADHAYHSKQLTTQNISNLAVPATNITIINYSEETMYAVVPGTAINDQLYAGRSDTIFNNSYYGDTRVMLQDWNRITFFDQFVCRRAILTIDGRPGYYRINIDRKFC